jgi:hypothetical protein
MRISKLIVKLESLKEKHGDIHLLIEQNGYGGYAMHTTKKDVKIQKMDIQTFVCEDSLDEKIVKEFFPSWDGDVDTNDNLEIKVAVISTEQMIYAT